MYYPDEGCSIKDNQLELVRRYILLGRFNGKFALFWFPYIFFNVLVNIGQLIYLYLVWGDLTKMVGMFATFTIEFQATYKLILLYWYSEKITGMHEIIDREFWDFRVSGMISENKLNRRMNLVRKILSIHLCGGIFGAVLYMTFPLTKYPPGIRELPIQCWFPFDTNPSPLHEFVYVTLASNGVLCIISIGIFDFSFIYFAQHLLVQFELLKNLLGNLTKGLKNGDEILDGDGDLLGTFHSMKFQKEIYRRLCVCIEHHTKLLSFGRELEKYSSVSIAIQLFVSLITFVIIGFILSSKDEEDLVISLKLAVYFWGVSLQLIIFAIHGSELQNESSSVSDSAYCCEWYLGRANTRNGLIFLQMNAQKIIKISAVGCIDLNNNTLVSVYRTAFSCVTLLQSLNDD